MPIPSRKEISRWTGLALLAVATLGMLQGVRAAIAQTLYRTAAFADPPLDPERLCSVTSRAHRFYPYQYRFCLRTAQATLAAATGADPADRARWLKASAFWTDRGLALNAFDPNLQLHKTRLLAETAPAQALRHWEAYVDWHFWDAYHHAVLVDLLVWNGSLEDARKVLPMLRESRYHAAAIAKIRQLENERRMDEQADRLIESLRP